MSCFNYYIYQIATCNIFMVNKYFNLSIIKLDMKRFIINKTYFSNHNIGPLMFKIAPKIIYLATPPYRWDHWPYRKPLL